MKTKTILNAKHEFIREEPMTEEELSKYPNTKLFVIDSSDGMVICDYCDKDYTNSNESGGLTFANHAACPQCAPRIEERAKRYNETQHIKHRCPEGMSYADWVRNVLR